MEITTNDFNMERITIRKVQNLITARPEGMDFERYKQLRKEQDIMLHGFNERIVGPGGQISYRHYPGRLEGVLIPSGRYHGHCSKDFQIVLN